MLRWLLPLLGTAIGCAPTPAEAPPKTPKPTATTSGAEEPAARDSAQGQRPFAAEDLRIPPGKLRFTGDLFAELPFATRGVAPQRLSTSAVALLHFEPGEYAGSRVLATLERFQQIDEPNDLVRFCVAKDGRSTFAVRRSNMLLHAPAFTGQMRALGQIEAEVNGAFIVRDPSNGNKPSFADCARGTIDDLSAVRGYVRILFNADTVTVLQLNEELKRTCRIRAGSSTAWEEVARCSYASQLEDGSVGIFADSADGSSKCAFAVGADAKRRPCASSPVGYRPATPEARIDFLQARFASRSLMVVVAEKGLHVMPIAGNRSDLKLIAPGHCAPLVPIGPLFRCASDDGRVERIVAVDAEGKARDELTLPVRGGDEARRFFDAGGGAVAMGGACDGTPGDAACVRQPGGTWKTVRFAPGLVAELHTTIPGALLLPTVSGEIFLATSVSETGGLLGMGPVDLLVFNAEKGLAARAKKAPLWIVGDMAGPTGLASSLQGSDGAAYGQGPGFLWRTGATFSAWPIYRRHPAFRTPETCRFDVSLDGSSRASCVPGRALAVGRFGVVEKKPGELFETYDAGGSYSQVPLPEGVDTRDVVCAAIGCRVGPYFRLGWGL
jgi:hypothetical protein